MPVKLTRPDFVEIPINADLPYVDKLTPRQFEHFVGVLLKTRGFTGIQVTQASGDHGVDVIANKKRVRYAIQAKLYSSTVGAEAVREPVASLQYYKCKSAMVVTNNYFTKQAKEYAGKVGCELVDRDVLKQWLYEYKLATSSSATDGIRLQFRRHRLLLAMIAALTLLVLILLLFSEPLCQVLC